ncbi:hypothetical protein FQR65_LT06074 [Abscondita terminalis]|nr:hypothetical protein FQR65_LT06074 [Abscondita terminalis]
MFNFVIFCKVILIAEAFLIGQKTSNKKLEQIKDLKVAEYEKAPLVYSKPSLNQKVASYRKTVDNPLYQDAKLGEYAPLNYGNKEGKSSISGLAGFQPELDANIKSLTPKFASKFNENGDEVNLHGEHPLYMQPLNPFSFMHPAHAHDHHDQDDHHDHDEHHYHDDHHDHLDFDFDHGHDHGDHDHDHGGHVFDWFDHEAHDHYIDGPDHDHDHDHELDFPEDILGHTHGHGHGRNHGGHDHHFYRAAKTEVKKKDIGHHGHGHGHDHGGGHDHHLNRATNSLKKERQQHPKYEDP